MRSEGNFRRIEMWRRSLLSAVLGLTVWTASSGSAWALITGGEGNDPLNDPGWPQGAAAVFNAKSRVAWWEGPPLGGGQWHAECRGDNAALQQVLEDFAKIDTEKKRIVLHDGVGHSFWLNPSRDPEKEEQAEIDWVLMVWQPNQLKRQRALPAGLRAVQNQHEMLAQLDVYAGGSLDWKAIAVPDGVKVVDQRLEAHGFSYSDGIVLEGTATDVASQQPISAKLVLQRIEPDPKGGYRYVDLKEAASDPQGHWVIKQAPAEWCRLVLNAEGYVPRVIGYERFDNQPRWSEHNSGLAKPGTVSGQIVDDQGKPLPGVEVRISDLEVPNAGRYELADESAVKTDEDGQFRFPLLPVGTASVWVHKSGYVRPGLGPKIEIPAADLKLTMQPAAALVVRVNFSATKRPDGYLVHVEPQGGEQVGKWSGSANIDEKNQFTFEQIPPGEYVITGRPNPGSDTEQTTPLIVELKGGKTVEVTIKAK